MPLYTYECAECGERTDAFRPMKDHDKGPLCRCGQPTKQVISTSQIVGRDYDTYINVIDRKPITGKRQHREFLKRNNVHEYGDTGEW